jgi:RND family efflux transporter MFP subunit
MEADAARVQYYKDAEKSALAQATAYGEVEKVARAGVRSAQVNEAYLRINAPFDGVITERNAHPGALAGPSGATSPAVLRLQQISRLRLVVAVPEAEIAGIAKGANINFTVPAFPGENFTGTVARIGHTLDPKTRTMSVELDVNNAGRKLAPGMFPQVSWPTRRPRPSLLVPASAVATTTEKSFVIRVRGDVAEWVDVKRGTSINQQGADLVEVFGDLAEGDTVAVRGTDELRAGTQVNAKPVAGK